MTRLRSLTLFPATLAGAVLLAFLDAPGACAAEARLIARSDGKFSRPHDIHLLRDGNLLVVDSGNHRLVTLDRNLRFVSALGGPPWSFNDPKYVTEGDAG